MEPAAALTSHWGALGKPWQLALAQAWQSWTEGNLGIGAVLVDPSDGEVVSTGRNRVNHRSDELRVLSGNFMAHAEMNVFAGMDRFRASGLDLYTSLEPCLMCAATAMFLHVAHVRYAASDEFFDGLDELWDQHPYPRRHRPERTGPLPKPLAAFARVLPLSVQAGLNSQDPVLLKADEVIPATAALARELASDGTLEHVRDNGGADGTGGDVFDALAQLWPRLAST